VLPSHGWGIYPFRARGAVDTVFLVTWSIVLLAVGVAFLAEVVYLGRPTRRNGDTVRTGNLAVIGVTCIAFGAIIGLT